MQNLVVIPTYNERENIPRIIPAILTAVPQSHVLIVDDGSPDGTGALVEAMAAKDARIRVLHRSGKQGLGTAYVAGFRYALARAYPQIVQMDADFSHRPEDLPRLLEALKRADVVVGSRNVPGGRAIGWSPLRTVVSRGGSLYTRLLLRLPIRDCTSGFKCFRREVLAALDLGTLRANGYGFQVEMNYLCHRAGFRMVEVPITFPDRRAGHSKMSAGIFLEAAGLVWELHRRPAPDRPGVQGADPEPRPAPTIIPLPPAPSEEVHGS